MTMIGIAGLLSVMAGGVVAYVAERFPAHIEALETAAGVLLIGGFRARGLRAAGDDLIVIARSARQCRNRNAARLCR